MHSYQKGSFVAHFNSDFSGDVILRKDFGEEISIPGQFLLELVAYGFVLPNKIAALEDMDAHSLLLPNKRS